MFPRQSRNEAPLRLSGLAVVFLLLAAVGARGKRTVSGRKTADFPYASSRAPTPGRRTRWDIGGSDGLLVDGAPPCGRLGVVCCYGAHRHVAILSPGEWNRA
ncbi:hypothetical protein AO996_29750 [Pseudomonas aeruginosa]|nr:hypothetical protein AO996_29750 [Pseudomonas aeruginosa]